MPNLTRLACTVCTRSVYNVEVEGPDGQRRRVPIAMQLQLGQPADTGPAINVLDPNVRVPSFVREMMLTPVAAATLCIECMAKLFGWPLVSPKEDPMYCDGVCERHEANEKIFRDESLPLIERYRVIHTRAFHAPAVAWAEAKPEDLPEDQRPIPRFKEGLPKHISEYTADELVELATQKRREEVLTPHAEYLASLDEVTRQAETDRLLAGGVVSESWRQPVEPSVDPSVADKAETA